MKKIRLKCVEKTPSKLAFVKLLKEVTGYGLKESKDIADTFDYDINKVVEFEILRDKSIDQFRKDLREIGGQYLVNGGVEFDREYKLLTLGLGEQEDYVDFISQNLNYFTNQQEAIKLILTKLSKEDLIEITNKLDYTL
jgi:translation elongation factor EF-Ts